MNREFEFMIAVTPFGWGETLLAALSDRGGVRLGLVALIEQAAVVQRILRHLGLPRPRR